MSAPPRIDLVVLVDDNEADNVFHEVVISRAGFGGQVRAFEEGALALQFLATLPADTACVVLLDINMPGMDGWTFAQQARPLLAARPAVMLVMLTSSSSAADRDRAAARAEIDGFLTKPLARDTVRELLDGRWPPRRH